MAIGSGQLIQMAIEIERIGIEFYEHLKRNFKPGTPGYRTLIMLRDDEIEHRKKYQLLMKQVEVEKRKIFSFSDKEISEMRTIVDRKIFDQFETAMKYLSDSPDIPQVLLYAIGIEYDTFYFFNRLADRVIPAEKDVIKEIIKEEKTHIEKLMGLRLKYKFNIQNKTNEKGQKENK